MRAGTDSISHWFPRAGRLQVRPGKLGTTLGTFCPFINCMQGVKGCGVDIGVVIVAGGDSAGVMGAKFVDGEGSDGGRA